MLPPRPIMSRLFPCRTCKAFNLHIIQ
jgi:hypothetical protein